LLRLASHRPIYRHEYPLEPNPKQTEPNSQAAVTNEPTIQEINDWDEDKLLKWIKQKKPNLLRDEKLKKFKAESISGQSFLKYAGNTDFFQRNCHLPAGTSSDLADLARETIDRKSKYYLSYNSDRQLTVSQGGSEQAGVEEPFDTASKKRCLDSRKEANQSPDQKRLQLSLLPGSGAIYETESAVVRYILSFHSWLASK
jgi:hypothetical protein